MYLDLRRPGVRFLLSSDILDQTATCRRGSDVVYGSRSGKVPSLRLPNHMPPEIFLGILRTSTGC